MKPDTAVAPADGGSLAARLTLVALVGFSAVSTDLYLSGIPQLVRDLGASASAGQLTLSLFMAGFAAGQLVFGPLSDHFGRKPVAAAGLWLYAVAALACTLAPGIDALLAARAVQGFAAASGPVIARAIVRDRYHGQEAARVMAQLAAAMAVVPLLAPVLGSWLLYWFDWRAQFALLLGFSLLTLAGLRSLAESCPSIGVAPLAFGGVVAQFGRCLARRRFLGFVLCGGSAFSAAFTWISSASYVVIELLGVAPQHFGYCFMLVVCGYMGGSWGSSRLVVRLGLRRTLLAGVGLSLTGASALVLQGLLGEPSLFPVLAAVFCGFMGSGLCLANAQMGAISEFPMAAGGASAVFGFLQTGMAAFAGWVVGRHFDGTVLPTGFTMLGGAVLAAAGWALLFAGRREES